MEGVLIPLAITACLLGSSAASYAFCKATQGKENERLENKITKLLSDPSAYYSERDRYLTKNKVHNVNIGVK